MKIFLFFISILPFTVLCQKPYITLKGDTVKVGTVQDFFDGGSKSTLEYKPIGAYFPQMKEKEILMLDTSDIRILREMISKYKSFKIIIKQ